MLTCRIVGAYALLSLQHQLWRMCGRPWASVVQGGAIATVTKARIQQLVACHHVCCDCATYTWMDGWVDGWMDGRTDGSIDRQREREIERYKEIERER